MIRLWTFLSVSFALFQFSLPNAWAAPHPGIYLNSDGSWIYSLIRSAQRSIDIEIYTMGDPEVLSSLRAALARGVQIRIVEEPQPLDNPCNVFGADSENDDLSGNCANQRAFRNEVITAGGIYEPFNKQNLCPNSGGPDGSECYEHGKLAIFDGQTALISTGNFDTPNLCEQSESPVRCDRDFSFVESDPLIVSTLLNIFQADLNGDRYDVRSLIPAALSQTLTVSPYSLNPILDFINSAQYSVEVEAQYLDQPDVNQALIAAAQAGKRVYITTASACAFGSVPSGKEEQIRSIYSAFDAAGISSRMFTASNLIEGKPGYMHAKMIFVDGERAWLGSENGSNQSFYENREFGVIASGTDYMARGLDVVRRDHGSSETESWQESLNCLKDR